MASVTSDQATKPVQDLEGNLANTPLPVLCQELSEGGRTGAVSIVGGHEIWFSAGDIYLVTTANGPALSDVLFGAGIGSLDEIESLFARAAELGSVTDRIVAVRPESEVLIRRLIHEYNLNSLFELLVPSTSAFRFEDGRRHCLGDQFAVETQSLMDQVQRRLEIWRKIATRISSTNTTFRLSPSLPNDTFDRVVSSDEWQFLAHLDGRTTVADVITATGESAFRVTSTLYRLLLEGLIAEVD